MTEHCCLQAEITLMRFHLGSRWWHLLASLLLPLTGIFFFSSPTSKEQREDLKQGPSCCFLISQWSTVVHSPLCDLCDIWQIPSPHEPRFPHL